MRPRGILHPEMDSRRFRTWLSLGRIDRGVAAGEDGHAAWDHEGIHHLLLGGIPSVANAVLSLRNPPMKGWSVNHPVLEGMLRGIFLIARPPLLANDARRGIGRDQGFER